MKSQLLRDDDDDDDDVSSIVNETTANKRGTFIRQLK